MGKARRRSAIHEPEYLEMIRRVRQARIESGMTQVEVARVFERPLSFVSKCELGERRIDPVDLVRFADLYDKPYEYFFPRRRQAARKRPGDR